MKLLAVCVTCFQVRHPRCVLYDQYMWYKIIWWYTTVSLLEVLVVFLATCFGSYTEPSSGYSSEWSVCTIVGALGVT